MGTLPKDLKKFVLDENTARHMKEVGIKEVLGYLERGRLAHKRDDSDKES